MVHISDCEKEAFGTRRTRGVLEDFKRVEVFCLLAQPASERGRHQQRGRCPHQVKARERRLGTTLRRLPAFVTPSLGLRKHLRPVVLRRVQLLARRPASVQRGRGLLPLLDGRVRQVRGTGGKEGIVEVDGGRGEHHSQNNLQRARDHKKGQVVHAVPTHAPHNRLAHGLLEGDEVQQLAFLHRRDEAALRRGTRHGGHGSRRGVGVRVGHAGGAEHIRELLREELRLPRLHHHLKAHAVVRLTPLHEPVSAQLAQAHVDVHAEAAEPLVVLVAKAQHTEPDVLQASLHRAILFLEIPRELPGVVRRAAVAAGGHHGHKHRELVNANLCELVQREALAGVSAQTLLLCLDVEALADGLRVASLRPIHKANNRRHIVVLISQ
eukprot:Rhum_TRINITY_DN25738_c0_g1::Rhum_TRINITY_DN25738_c0_g1_i1::g.182692::m.182692